MKSQRRRLIILCEDNLHQRFIERLADRWGIGPRQRQIQASPAARGAAAQYVLDDFPAAVRRWRAQAHDANVGLLVMIDGDQYGVARRRQQLAALLEDPVEASDAVAIFAPTWHVETWIAWLCGHRPVDEITRYKPEDEVGRDVARRIKSGEYSPRAAADAWLVSPPADEQTSVPSLTAARGEVTRIGV